MTVKELIEKLQALPPDATVLIANGDLGDEWVEVSSARETDAAPADWNAEIYVPGADGKGVQVVIID